MFIDFCFGSDSHIAGVNLWIYLVISLTNPYQDMPKQFHMDVGNNLPAIQVEWESFEGTCDGWRNSGFQAPNRPLGQVEGSSPSGSAHGLRDGVSWKDWVPGHHWGWKEFCRTIDNKINLYCWVFWTQRFQNIPDQFVFLNFLNPKIPKYRWSVCIPGISSIFLDVRRSGNIVIAVVPKRFRGTWIRVAVVGIAASIWKAGKVPKLATSSIPLVHCLAVRVFQLSQGREPNMWQSSSTPDTWMVRAQGIVAVLDSQSSEECNDCCTVVLSPESMSVVAGLSDIPDWWPQDDSVSGKVIQRDLFLPRQGKSKKRKSADAKNNAPGHDEAEAAKGEKESADLKKDKKTKKKKKCVKNKKSGKTPIKLAKIAKNSKKKEEVLDMKPENIKKCPSGEQVIVKEMNRLKDLDKAVFKSSSTFSDSNLCRLKVSKCEGVPWLHIVKHAFAFFKVQSFVWLSFIQCHWNQLRSSSAFQCI